MAFIIAKKVVFDIKVIKNYKDKPFSIMLISVSVKS